MSFMYGGYDTNTQATFAGNIAAGITENVSLIDIAVEDAKKDGTGGKVLRFHFQAENGDLHTHTEFPINLKMVEETARKEKKTVKEVGEKEANAQAMRVKHILDAFVPKEKNIMPPVKTWEEFMDGVLTIAGRAFESRKFRIKLILNNKDYERFPRVPGKGFIQPMEEKNTLTIDPKWDRVVKKEAPANGAGGEADPYGSMGDAGSVDSEFAATDSFDTEPDMGALQPANDFDAAPGDFDPEAAF